MRRMRCGCLFTQPQQNVGEINQGKIGKKKHKQNMMRKNILPTNSADVFVLHIILYFYLQFMHMEKKKNKANVSIPRLLRRQTCGFQKKKQKKL